MTTFEKELDIGYTFSLRKTTVNFAKYATTAHTLDARCPLTQACHVNFPITLSNYKHDAYIVLSVLK